MSIKTLAAKLRASLAAPDLDDLGAALRECATAMNYSGCDALLCGVHGYGIDDAGLTEARERAVEAIRIIDAYRETL